MIRKKRIVAVDDSNIILKMLKNAFDNEEYELRAFSAGTRALEFLEQVDESKKPDLIILDIEMPIMNGYDVLNRIKKIDLLKCVPVIFLTSNSQKRQVVKAVTGGIKDYVVKPIDKDALSARVHTLLKDVSVEVEEEQAVEEKEEQAAEGTEEQAAEGTEEQAAEDQKEKAAEGTEEQAAEDQEEQAAEGTEEQAAEGQEEKAAEGQEEKTADGKDDQ